MLSRIKYTITYLAVLRKRRICTASLIHQHDWKRYRITTLNHHIICKRKKNAPRIRPATGIYNPICDTLYGVGDASLTEYEFFNKLWATGNRSGYEEEHEGLARFQDEKDEDFEE